MHARAPQALTEASLAELSEGSCRLLDAAQVVVVDLDGCLAVDLMPLPGAVEFVTRWGSRLVVASNNSTHSAGQLADILERRGLSIPPGRFVLAGEVAVRFVASQWPGARVMLLGTQAIGQAARHAGLQLAQENCDVVLLTRALDTNFAQLEAAVAAVHRGAELVVANPDLSHPGAGGVPRIESGALLALMRSVLPQLRAAIIGKPEAPMFRAALELDGIPAEHAVMIGDNPATDIAGAARMRMHTIELVARRRPAQAALPSAAQRGPVGRVQLPSPG